MDTPAGLILRVSTKLAKKIRLDYEQRLPPSPNPFLDWSADLFTADRTQYILFTNTATLYSMVTFGRGVTSETPLFGDAIAAMRDVLRADGLLPVFEQAIAPRFYPTAIAKRENRSVIGSMNDLIIQARFRLVLDEVSPYDASTYVNGTPMSYLDYRTPRDDFRSMAREYLAHR